MSITRGEFLKSLGKSLPGLVASTGVTTVAGSLFRRLAQAAPENSAAPVPAALKAAEEAPVEFFRQGRADNPGLALTFDDGPVPGVTERILDTLGEHGVLATFFMIGEKAEAAPDLARRVVAEGHEIGHHTYSHRKLTELPAAEFEDELDRTLAMFAQLLSCRPAWFRPPFGALRQDQARHVQERGMRVALWSVDAEDWRDGVAASVTERVSTHLHPGAVVLSHELPVTVASLDATLKHIRAATRFLPQTLSQLVTSR